MLLLTEPDPYLAVFGRFHIVLLHLPIGLLPGIALLEFGAALLRKPIPRGSVLTLAIMTALTAGAALASGLVLAGEKVDSELLGDHKLAAIVMTVVCALLPILAAFKKRAGFRVTLLVALGLSVWAGHLGGSLSHKKDFLFKPLQRAAAKQDTNKATTAPQSSDNQPANNNDQPNAKDKTSASDQAVSFKKDVAPIFQRVCNDCHNAEDYDGDLDLTTKNGILCIDRDEADRVLVPGKPDDSYLIQLCEYPEDDDERMPPIDEEIQLKKAELATLRKWILQGCKFD